MTETAVPAANEAASTTTSAAAATPQAALDVLLCDILPRQGCWSDEAYLWAHRSQSSADRVHRRPHRGTARAYVHAPSYPPLPLSTCSATISGRAAASRWSRG